MGGTGEPTAPQLLLQLDVRCNLLHLHMALLLSARIAARIVIIGHPMSISPASQGLYRYKLSIRPSYTPDCSKYSDELRSVACYVRPGHQDSVEDSKEWSSRSTVSVCKIQPIRYANLCAQARLPCSPGLLWHPIVQPESCGHKIFVAVDIGNSVHSLLARPTSWTTPAARLR